MKDLKRKKDGDFETPIDKTLLKIKSSGKKMKRDDIKTRHQITLSTKKLATFDEKKGWCLTKEGKKRLRLLEDTTKGYEVLFNSLLMESDSHNSLLLLDIDKTLVEPRNIYIYRKHPNDNQEVRLTPEEFAKDPLAKDSDNKKYYDFREFRDPEKVAESIKTGLPIVSNLKLMDNYINNGWKIGVLTARGLEDVVASTMKQWLQFRDLANGGKLRTAAAKLSRNLIFAINDDSRVYKGFSDFDRKANVILNLANDYDRVWLLDDDEKNIKAVNRLAEKKGMKNKIKAMLAKS